MSQPNQNIMGLVLQNPSQNTHMLVNVAGSTGFIGQSAGNIQQPSMANMVQLQPQNHHNIHQVVFVIKVKLFNLCYSLLDSIEKGMKLVFTVNCQ